MPALLDVWSASGEIVKPDATKIAEGWLLTEKPPHEYMNWWMNIVVQRINHVLQQGVAEWDATITYPANAFCRRQGLLWRASATNTNSAPPSANWRQISESASTLSTGILPNARLTGTYTGVQAMTVVGAVTAGSFVGPGAGITGLNAANLASGVVPSERLSGVYTHVTSIAASGTIQAGGGFGGSGAGLSNLNASQLAAGSVPNARLAGSYTNVQVITTSGNVNVGGQLNVAGSAVINGTLTVAGNSETGSGSFQGNGSQLTNLNATQLTQGTVPSARISGVYTGFSRIDVTGPVRALGAGGNMLAEGNLVVDGTAAIGGGVSAGNARFSGDGSLLIVGPSVAELGNVGVTTYIRPRGVNKTDGQVTLHTNGLLTASAYAGSGAYLTDLPGGQITGTIPAGVLPATGAGTAWIRGRLATIGVGQVGTFACLKYNGAATAPGTIREGNLFYAATDGTIGTAAPGRWMCLGQTFGADTDRTTMWVRVE